MTDRHVAPDLSSPHRQVGPLRGEAYCKAVHSAIARLVAADDPLVTVAWSVQEWAEQDITLNGVGRPSMSC